MPLSARATATVLSKKQKVPRYRETSVDLSDKKSNPFVEDNQLLYSLLVYLYKKHPFYIKSFENLSVVRPHLEGIEEMVDNLF